MPTPFAIVVLGLLLVAAVVGVVLWVRQTGRRSRAASAPRSPRATGREAPWDESTGAAQQIRQSDRSGWGT